MPAAPPLSADPAVREQAEEAMFRLRTGSCHRVAVGALAAGIVVVALAWSPSYWPWLAAWFGLLVLNQWFRIWCETRACAPRSGRSLHQRVGMAGISAMVSGLVQALSLGFFSLEDAFAQSLHTLILLVLTTGAVVYTAGHPRIFLPFMLPIMLGLTLAWWIGSTAADDRPGLAFGFGALVLVYAYNLLGYARDTWTMFLNAAAMQHHEAQQSQSLKDSVRAAEAASHAKTRFLAAASHDLRQPIHTIALLAGTLKLRHQQDKSNEVVTLLDSVVQSLSHQLDDLLDISKLDAGVVKVAAQTLSLQRFLQRRLSEVHSDAAAKGLTLRLDAPEDVSVHTDPNLLERVLRNLLSNAVKFTEHGEIVLSLSAKDDMVAITLRDTGCGIAPENHLEVFHEFVQLNNPERDRTKGMGLGLSIVSRLCKLMDMELTLQSIPEQGSTFELRLPQHPSLDIEWKLPIASQQMLQLDLTVLVVDDEAMVRTATSLLLAELGCRCLEADCLTGALLKAQYRRPDFLIADYRLRGDENGIDVVRALRDRYPGLPAAIVTGDSGAVQLQAIELADLPLLHKPVRLETLVQLLNAAASTRSNPTYPFADWRY